MAAVRQTPVDPSIQAVVLVNPTTGAAYAASGGGGSGTSDTTEATQLLVKTAVEATNTAVGTTADAAATAGSAGTLSAKLRLLTSQLSAVVLGAGSALIGKVGIDQTTPGTTDSVTVKAGGGGSTRSALARENLKQLGEQRLGTVAAATSADIEGRRQQAAGTLLSAGQAGLTAAQQAAMSRVGLAQVPQDVYSKYASIVYGVPQASTVSNFAGTQGQKQASKGFGF